MSELLPGLALPPPPPPAEPVPAAAVILWRPGPRGRELFWVTRGALRFAGGFRAFPGGRLDAADREVPVAGAAAEDRPFVACAARELFEETGVLLARGPAVPSPARDALRRTLLEAGAASAQAAKRAAPLAETHDRGLFAAFLREHGLSVDGGVLAPAGRWITPAWSPLRYDAHTFLARLPEAEVAEVWPGELDAGAWIAAADALALWERGEVLLHPPNLWGISCLAAAEPPACLGRLRDPPATEGFVTRRVEFQRGIFSAPLRTPTLPPATHTNAYLLPLAGGGLAVVDPGPSDPGELGKLAQVIEDLAPEHGPLREVWLTHRHADHVGAARWAAERYRAAIRAHPDTLRAVGLPGERIADGDLLGGRFRARHTPGHAAGHVAFVEERTGALLAGDLVSTLSTIVIDPPEGDMRAYWASLARARDAARGALFPAHGPPVHGAAAQLDRALAHRRAREAKVLGALPGTLPEVTARAYDDTPPAVWPIAERSCLASLVKLTEERRARQDGARWIPA